MLFVIGRSMNADEIVETLGVARSNVSNSIRELQNWQLVQAVHLMGDRRDHFTTSDDVWALFRTIVAERQRREIEPTIRFLNELIESDEFKQENEDVRRRIRETHDFVSTLTAWAQEMLKLSTNTLSKVLKLGASIQKLLR